MLRIAATVLCAVATTAIIILTVTHVKTSYDKHDDWCASVGQHAPSCQ